MRSTFVLLCVVLLLGIAAHAGETVPASPEPLNIAALYGDAMPSGPELTPLQPVVPLQKTTIAVFPSEPRRAVKMVDKKFIALTALVFGLTAADVELTQHCIHAGTCYEMNPSLPRSRWGQYAVNTLTNTAVTYLAYHRRSKGKWGWWVAPVIDIGAHAGGIGSNMRFAW